MARYGQIIPCNWSHSDTIQWIRQDTPLGFAVAEARNLIVDHFLAQEFEWLFFIDHDVVLPPDTFVKMNQYMLKAEVPVVTGLYYAKSHPAEPLLYRGRGNSYYSGWKLGDKVWVDGIPMGCTLIHRSLLKVMAKDAPLYSVPGHRKIKQVFDTPSGAFYDPEKGYQGFAGTEDLAWCNRILAGHYLKKAGWPKVASKKYPFLVDTSLFCFHITEQGQKYPLGGYSQ